MDTISKSEWLNNGRQSFLVESWRIIMPNIGLSSIKDCIQDFPEGLMPNVDQGTVMGNLYLPTYNK